MNNFYSHCTLCPRKCGTDRTTGKGFCGAGSEIIAAKASLHLWEEPCISAKNGAGTVFFSGCSLHCCFCQNHVISAELSGMTISPERLGDIFLELRDKGAENIELVTPTHFVPSIITALERVRDKLGIPVVYNSGGYETTDTIRLLDGLVDVYLPDIKFFSPEISAKYANAPDYFQFASKAVLAMTEQVGDMEFSPSGKMLRGTIIRHLVLPGCRHDSMSILDWIAGNIPEDRAMVSIMSQYTPFDHVPESCPELHRRVTKMEYNSVVRHADELGLKGYTQEKSSAKEEYVPDFNCEGIY